MIIFLEQQLFPRKSEIIPKITEIFELFEKNNKTKQNLKAWENLVRDRSWDMAWPIEKGVWPVQYPRRTWVQRPYKLGDLRLRPDRDTWAWALTTDLFDDSIRYSCSTYSFKFPGCFASWISSLCFWYSSYATPCNRTNGFSSCHFHKTSYKHKRTRIVQHSL